MTTLSAPRLHVTGPKSAPCLVFGNALGSAVDLWASQERAMAAELRVVTFDYPGHGGADDASYRSLADLARALLVALDAERIMQFCFCGISMGGAVGIELAHIASQRLRGLLLCNTAARFGTVDLWDGRIAKAQQDGMESLADAAVARWLTPELADAAPATAAKLRTMFSSTSVHGYTQACRAIRDFDARALLAGIDTPTLVIAGAFDIATPPVQAMELHRGIRDSHCIELPAAHLSNICCPDDFTAAVQQFIHTTLQH